MNAESKEYLNQVTDLEYTRNYLDRSSLVFFPGHKGVKLNFAVSKKIHSNETHACTCILVACVFPSKINHDSNSIEWGFKSLLQLQFEETQHTKIHSIEKMTMHNSGDKMDLEDPFFDFIRFQVKKILKNY